MDQETNWENCWQTEKDNAYWKIPDPDFVSFIENLTLTDLSVLDFGCGLGRHSIYLAHQGFNVTAIDSSETAIHYLIKWAKKEKLDISTYVGNLNLNSIAHRQYDLIVSINVIYHGRRKSIEMTIDRIHKKIKKDGLFYLTFLDRDDDKYGVGKEVEPHTFMCDLSIHEGDIHYFADESDLKDLFKSFEIVSLKKVKNQWMHKGKKRFSSFWKMYCKPILV
jgi:2-polyprenyl-3-methyl-5-hydroxy-6-metoxy-1,4-benzoquinol methylase